MQQFNRIVRRLLLPALCWVSTGVAVEVTVCPHGTGDYTSVQAAIVAVPTGSMQEPVTIRIKAGIYDELVYIQREKRHLLVIGESKDATVIRYGLHANQIGLDGQRIGTFRTPTVTVDADDIYFENITFENSAGPVGQALAIRVDGDRVVFRNCGFNGWQDTVFVNRGRHYFENCRIVGSTDYIFGGATAYFRNCELHSLRSSYITAASTPQENAYGFVFDNCSIEAATEELQVYLGRPWRDYAAVIFMDTQMPAQIRAAGWHNWNRPERESSARFYEFGNRGPGAVRTARVAWSRKLTAEQAQAIHPVTVLGEWVQRYLHTTSNPNPF